MMFFHLQEIKQDGIWSPAHCSNFDAHLLDCRDTSNGWLSCRTFMEMWRQMFVSTSSSHITQFPPLRISLAQFLAYVLIALVVSLQQGLIITVLFTTQVSSNMIFFSDNKMCMTRTVAINE